MYHVSCYIYTLHYGLHSQVGLNAALSQLSCFILSSVQASKYSELTQSHPPNIREAEG